MCTVGMWRLFTVVALAAGAATSVVAQEPEATTREAAIEQEQAEKVKTLHPYVPGKVEGLLNRVEDILVNGVPRWHPFFESAYYGGGFTLGAGYAHHVSPYNMLDVRGSYTILGYKRIEAEFTAPRLFHRRGSLSLLGGWREATQAAFYGIGMDTSKDDRTNFDFQQPYGSATLTLWPTRRLLMLRGGLELSQWSQRPGEGDVPIGRDRLHACNPAGPWHQDHVSAFARHRRVRLAHLARLFPARRLLRRHAARLRRQGRAVRFPADRLRSDPACSDPARSLGHLAPRPRADHVQQDRSAGARSSCCRTWAVDRRCEDSPATASATRTA